MSKRLLQSAVAVAATVAATVITFPSAAQAAERPDFQLPAPCGETWSAATYPGHDPQYSVDLNHYPGDDTGRPVVASAAGTVEVAGNSGGWAGIHVRINHGGGWTTHYAHLSRTEISAAATVQAGQLIGRVGNTGKSTGPHLHFEQTLNGEGRPAVFDGVTFTGASRTFTSANCGSPETPSPAPVSAVGDLTGDGKPDVVARAGTGDKTLWIYPGLGNGRLGTRIDNGGWGSIDQVSGVGDVTGDGKAEVLAVEKSTGKLWVYPGQSNGHLGARVDNGGGWNTMRIAGARDLNGDGRGDLLATEEETGTLYLYPGQTNGHFGTRVAIGSNWDAMSTVSGTGDLNGDGKGDVVAVEEAGGKLFFYPGLGNGQLGSRVEAGTGWGVMSSVSGAGDYTGDGKADLVARENDGHLWIYPGLGNGQFGARVDNGGGWNFTS